MTRERAVPSRWTSETTGVLLPVYVFKHSEYLGSLKEGGQLVAYPSIPEDTMVTLRVAPESIREYKGKVRISRAERVA